MYKAYIHTQVFVKIRNQIQKIKIKNIKKNNKKLKM